MPWPELELLGVDTVSVRKTSIVALWSQYLAPLSDPAESATAYRQLPFGTVSVARTLEPLRRQRCLPCLGAVG